VRFIQDTTRRFPQRPYYEATELDQECDSIISVFLRKRYGDIILPIPTDALTKLIEQDADDLDLYADLSEEGLDVEGVTDFFVGQKPKVRIAHKLTDQSRYEYRLRTTLTHEYGHVKFHKCLWEQHNFGPALFLEWSPTTSPKCKRENIFDATKGDWMEWQAGYICGAILMPISSLRKLVSDYVESHNLYGPILSTSAHAQSLRALVANCFCVSQEAARVRLTQLRYLTNNTIGPSLFS
jgi:hypothetical protein